MKSLRKDTAEEIKQLSSKLNRLCSRIRQKHRNELKTLREMKKTFTSEQQNSIELKSLDNRKEILYNIE